MIVIHKKTNKVLAKNLKHANTVFSRLKGLMFMSEMRGMDALLLDPCNSIHNCFVRFPIDVIFLTKNYEVVHIIRGFRPWRFSWIYFKASMVLELPIGTLGVQVEKGDLLEVRGV